MPRAKRMRRYDGRRVGPVGVGLAAAGAGASRSLGLAAYWRLDEESGTRADVRGLSPLADHNGVSQSPGKPGSAAHFASASTQYLSAASTPTLQAAAGDFTVCGWYYLDSTGVDQGLIGKWGAGNEYVVWLAGSVNKLVLQVGADFVVNSLVLTTAVYYFVAAWQDDTAKTLNIAVDNGTADSAAYVGSHPVQADQFEMGRFASAYVDGRLDEWGLWKRVLTAGELAVLRNGGAGRTYPFL